MDTLKNLSLESISLNLNLNSKLCKNNSFVIPPKIGDEIYEYLIKCIREISEDESEFFNSNYMKLSSICLNKEIFLLTKYNFLKGYHLNVLCLEGIDGFNIDFGVEKSEFIIITNNLIIKNCTFFNGDLYNTQHFLENCIIAKESISLCGINDEEFNFDFSKLINKSINSLKVLDFVDTFIIEKNLNDFTRSLGKLSKLEEFSLKIKYKMWTLMRIGSYFIKNILFALSNCSETLKKISIPKTGYFADDFIGLLKKLRNLEDISFFLNRKFEQKEVEILNTLTEYNSKSLKKIYCNASNFEKNNALQNFIKSCNRLEYFKIDVSYESMESYIFESLESSASTLKKIEFSRYAPGFAKLYEQCSALETIIVRKRKMCESLMKSMSMAIKLSKNSLNIIHLNSFSGETCVLKDVLESLSLVNSITELRIRSSAFDEETTKILCKLIKKHGKELQLLDLSRSNLDTMEFDELRASFERCHVIKILQLYSIELCYQGTFFLPNFAPFYVGLVQLDLRKCYLTEDHYGILSRIFEHCRNLKTLNLSNNEIGKNELLLILNNLKWSQKTLREFLIPKLMDTEERKFIDQFFTSSTFLRHNPSFHMMNFCFNDSTSPSDSSDSESNDSDEDCADSVDSSSIDASNAILSNSTSDSSTDNCG